MSDITLVKWKYFNKVKDLAEPVFRHRLGEVWK